MSKLVSELFNAVAYERSMLERIYGVKVNNDRPEIDIEMSYGKEGKPLRQSVVRACLDLGDSRSGFASVGAPMIFTASFKVLDACFEWMIKSPGKRTPNQIEHKLEALNELSPDGRPALFESEKWLFERLVSLYRRTALLRNTLAHRGEFEVSASGLQVRLGTQQAEDERTPVSGAEIEAFAATTLMVVRLLAGASTLDGLCRKRLRHRLDTLARLHEMETLGQRPVQFGRVKLSFPEPHAPEFDLAKLREDIDPVMSIPDGQGNFYTYQYDTVFEIQITIDSASGSHAEYLIPYSEVDKYPTGIPCEALPAYLIKNN
ncbi:hypothetical protein [Burkholderia glumae]|uniref:hypothetical protein n=1 Tax=Burkholderia glumae TaxID=337 RepID=UPI00054ADE66|nr:hypothetical protein [Burkholderia glumae]KHJ59558.1 hypothetical protein NCPPB3923_28735 [Burkholderia glumae]